MPTTAPLPVSAVLLSAESAVVSAASTSGSAAAPSAPLPDACQDSPADRIASVAVGSTAPASLLAPTVPALQASVPPSVQPQSGGQPHDTRQQHRVPLHMLLPLEAACAVVSAGLVAPLISIVDKSIFANASGQQPLLQGLLAGIRTLLTRPAYFVRQPSFLLIWGVYSGTYITANTVQALCDHAAVPWQIPKFVGSSIANVGLSVLKDLYFTRAFGSGPARPVPPKSYTLYMTRDALTIFSSFNLPPLLSSALAGPATPLNLSPGTTDTVAQLVAPCAMQILSTPLHLHGMDLYNRPDTALSARDRVAFIRREYVVTTAARVARIFPAFGIGGVANKYLRTKGRAWLETL
ncbi:hypothetical protein BC831DRAFT_444284 [Entophlyctis helioformis]|nr:hypothetical protein BC831DRAFT_444284 [Entophlyctis helioformis]